MLHFSPPNIHYRPSDNWHFVVTADIEVSDQFYGWICGLHKNVTILDPPEVVEGFKDFLSDISSKISTSIAKLSAI